MLIYERFGVGAHCTLSGNLLSYKIVILLISSMAVRCIFTYAQKLKKKFVYYPNVRYTIKISL